MKIIIDTVSAFITEFHRVGRKDQFSRPGLEALFDYLNESGEDMELDVIALCCEFSEYESAIDYFQQNNRQVDLNQIADDLGIDWKNPDFAVDAMENPEGEDEVEEEAFRMLSNEHLVIQASNGYILVQN